YYSYWNTAVHGLSRCDTDYQPLFPEVWSMIHSKIADLPLVAHNRPFDENCLRAVFKEYGLTYPEYQFYCTLSMSRRTLRLPNYQLDTVAKACGYDLSHHHNALADAEACAAIAMKIF
ncbi:MAG: 3'-5' exoribonuclease, partial [Muribaculum sp.]|nr:3'-5' exoribonuclease [Muribaculum sp.]